MRTDRNCILRLSRYKTALKRLKSIGFARVFSDNLADATGVSATRVRKDFAQFGIRGNRKGGYAVDDLAGRLSEVLGTSKPQNVVVVGVGRIGMALLDYQGLRSEGIHVVAGFDTNPGKLSRSGRIPILPLEELAATVARHDVRIGIIAVPASAAQQAFDLLVTSGVKGILNFAPAVLGGSDRALVANVDLAAELENLIYFVGNPAAGGEPSAE